MWLKNQPRIRDRPSPDRIYMPQIQGTIFRSRNNFPQNRGIFLWFRDFLPQIQGTFLRGRNVFPPLSGSHFYDKNAKRAKSGTWHSWNGLICLDLRTIHFWIPMVWEDCATSCSGNGFISLDNHGCRFRCAKNSLKSGTYQCTGCINLPEIWGMFMPGVHKSVRNLGHVYAWGA